MAWLVVALVVAVYALYVRWDLRRGRGKYTFGRCFLLPAQ
jgi:hypothetical protein